jgi:PPP family 3-phenylpropionic acid transporter
MRVLLGGAYVSNFGALAAYGPFLALYLEHRGLGPRAIAHLLAMMLLVRVVASPAWTLLADRWQSPARVLALVSVGSLASFGLAEDAPLAIALLVFSAFRAPFGALIDTMVLRTDRPFGSLRAWGTAGYTAFAFATGALVDRVGPRAVWWVTLIPLALAVLFAFLLPAAPSRVERPALVRPLALLLQKPRFLLLLAVAALHQVGLAPYDALFPAHLTKLAGASYAGIAVAVGAGAELLFLVRSPAVLRALGASRLLALACAASVLRWGLTAVVTAPWLLVAIQVLHAFGFGAFHVASVTLVHEEAPPTVRASAQGVFSAAAFGIAPAGALAFAGWVTPHIGLRGAFAIAAGASALAMLLATLLSPAAAQDERGEAKE